MNLSEVYSDYTLHSKIDCGDCVLRPSSYDPHLTGDKSVVVVVLRMDHPVVDCLDTSTTD